MIQNSPVATLLLTASDVIRALPLPDCIDAVERAFALHHAGKAIPPQVLALHGENGGFHVKAAGLPLDRLYTAIKINANFPENPAKRRLPTIQGVVALFDATDGRVLALLDSMEITSLRTAAATAVAARHLARPGASRVAILGCGVQARAQLRALAAVRPVAVARAYDLDADRAASFASELQGTLGITITVARSAAEAAHDAEIVATCTPSRRPILRACDVAPGAFVAAVGADNPDKEEIDPDLFARATVVADLAEQCAAIGDLRHAIAAGAIALTGVHADLGDIAAGARPGRRSADEIVLFDSTGTALQDVAAAALAYENTLRLGIGAEVRFGA